MPENQETPGGQQPGVPPSGENEAIPARDFTSGDPDTPSGVPWEFADELRDVSATELTLEQETRRRELHAAAVDYWNLGFRCITLHWMENGRCSCGREDCASPGKHPIDEAWQNLGMDPDQDSEWWRLLGQGETSPRNWRPRANIGIVCGQASGIVVLDIDVGGGFETLARLEAEHPEEPLPATMLAETGKGGRHWVFRHPGVKVSNGKPWGKSSGIDLKADRGMIVAAPSISGYGPYRWIQNVTSADQIAAAPGWIVEEIIKERDRQQGEPVSGEPPPLPQPLLTKYVRSALDNEAAIMRATPQGNRNDQLNNSAFALGTLGAHGLIFEDEAKAALEAAALAAGLPMHEIRGTFLSGWRAGLASPRDLSAIGQLKEHQWPYLPWDDLGLGDRLVVRKGDVLRYVETWDSWMICQNGAWRRCSDATPEMAAMAMIRNLFDEEKELYPEEPDKEGEASLRAKFRAWWKTLRTPVKAALCIRAARDHPMIRATDTSFDDYPFLLNCSNGIINLGSGELGPHEPARMMTHQAPVSFSRRLMEDPLARAPLWKAFLERVQPDPEIRAYLQRVVGYSITGSVAEQVMWLHHGTGANGKSVFHETLAHVLGPYAQSTPVETLTAKRDDGRVPNDVARMVGRRYLLASEAKEGRRLDWPLLKQLIGGDRVAARYMRAEFFEFSVIGKIHMTANHLPPIPGDDTAIWRRLWPLEWPVQISKEERDTELAEKLRAEGPAILAWAVQGAVEWRRIGLATPESVERKRDAYRQEEDKLGLFIEAYLDIVPDAQASHRPPGQSSGEIFSAFQFVAKLMGWEEKEWSQRKLTSELKRKRHHYVSQDSWRGFTDLRVKKDFGFDAGP